MTQKLPHITKELLDYLDALYPDQMPDPDIDREKFIKRASAVAVVRHLKDVHKQQTETALTGDYFHVLK